MQLEVKTIFEPDSTFCGLCLPRGPLWIFGAGTLAIHVCLEPHWQQPRQLLGMSQTCPGYDRLPSAAGCSCAVGHQDLFLLRARRVTVRCTVVVVEHIPWSDGKRRSPSHDVAFCPVGRGGCRGERRRGPSNQLGMRLSLGGVVCSMGPGASEAGKRSLSRRGRDSLGKSKRADNFLTVVYQIDSHCRRLLWVGNGAPSHAAPSLEALGEEVVSGLRLCAATCGGLT